MGGESGGGERLEGREGRVRGEREGEVGSKESGNGSVRGMKGW